VRTLTKEEKSYCENCNEELQDECYEIVSIPNKDFKTRILATYCSKCGLKILEEARKEGLNPIEVG